MMWGWNGAVGGGRWRLRSDAKGAITAGAILGVVVSAFLVVAAFVWGDGSLGKFLAIVPGVLFVPPWVGMLLGAIVTSGRAPRESDYARLQCMRCGCDLVNAMDSRQCPGCSAPFDPRELVQMSNFGMSAAMRTILGGLLGCVIGTLIGLVIMAPFIWPR